MSGKRSTIRNLIVDFFMITPIAGEHIESFHRAFDRAAREGRYLAFLEAPPIESTRTRGGVV